MFTVVNKSTSSKVVTFSIVEINWANQLKISFCFELKFQVHFENFTKFGQLRNLTECLRLTDKYVSLEAVIKFCWNCTCNSFFNTPLPSWMSFFEPMTSHLNDVNIVSIDGTPIRLGTIYLWQKQIEKNKTKVIYLCDSWTKTHEEKRD